jgi:transposase
VRQVESGAKRPAQICRELELAESPLRWRREYEMRGEAAFTPRQPPHEQALVARIAELERHCGQLSLELATAKKVLSRPQSRSGMR